MNRRIDRRALVRRLSRIPGADALMARTVRRMERSSADAQARLASVYRKLPASQGLPAGVTVEAQRSALLAYYARLAQRVANAERLPTISIVLPTHRPNPDYLREAIGSIALQTYPHWQLCLVDDASGDGVAEALAAEFAALHPGKVEFRARATNGHISAASNDALALATGDYVALLDHDDRLYPHALAEVALAIVAAAAEGRAPGVLYTDERLIDADGDLLREVWLKPDWMPLLHLTSNYTNHLSVYDRALLERLGGFRAGFEGSQDHDLMLRASEVAPVLHVPVLGYQWRSHPGSVAGDPNVKSYSIERALEAVRQACERRGTPARVWREPGLVPNRIDFDLPSPVPEVRVVRVVAGAPLDVAALVSSCPAPYLVVLADDLDPVQDDWLDAMLRLATLPEVGIVGALVTDARGVIDSVGLVGVGTGLAPAWRGVALRPDLYHCLPTSIHEVLAVAPDAFMVDVAAAREAGAREVAPGPWSSAELSLRLREAGLASACTPYARFQRPQVSAWPAVGLDQREALTSRWAEALAHDPYLHPGLVRSGSFTVDPAVWLPEVPTSVFRAWLEAGRVG